MTDPYTGPVDPPTTWGYPAQRVATVKYTAMGPVAIRAEDAGLPEGWYRDEFGVLRTEYAGTKYAIAGGKVYRETGTWTNYGYGPNGTAGRGLVPTLEEVPENEVPSDNGFRRLWKANKAETPEPRTPDSSSTPKPGGGFGTTSPGSAAGWENRPAAMGGPLNPDGFLGEEILREQYGMSDAEIAAYSTGVDPGRGVLPGLGKKQQYEGTYYQRMAVQRAVSKGYGRPQYTATDVANLNTMDPQQLISFQVQAKRVGLPGAESIVLGAPNDPATISAYTWALTQANLMGRPINAALQQLGDIAAAAEKGLDGTGTTGGFDPVKTRTSVSLTGQARARAQLRSMMSQMLDRMPTNSEVEAYAAKLNAKEKADPTVTTYTYQRDGDTSVTTEQTDVDAQLIAERAIKKGNPKEYEAMQSVKYYNALLDMLG
jgi:hypothetical protein